MATIKSYSDLQQSRKLAEILPLESADYYHAPDAGVVIVAPYITYYGKERCVPAYKGAVPCWSLASLIHIIKNSMGYEMQSFDCKTACVACDLGDKPWRIVTKEYDNEIDACVEMILKLNELKVL